MAEGGAAKLVDYVKRNPGFQRVYDSYQPAPEIVEQIVSALPEGRLVAVAEYWCGDSRRLVPRMARIAEKLPAWQFEVYPWDRIRRAQPWQVRAVPTFIVYVGDDEIGRIVERPKSGSLEEELLHVVSKR
jgi:hypothetical protein